MTSLPPRLHSALFYFSVISS